MASRQNVSETRIRNDIPKIEYLSGLTTEMATVPGGEQLFPGSGRRFAVQMQMGAKHKVWGLTEKLHSVDEVCFAASTGSNGMRYMISSRLGTIFHF